tara:strand:- start:573 stop:1040 length:468 start_codon:yes stop_codon:yes gene_type:complete
MESNMKKDGSEKTLFDYSPQNQNYIIVDDLLDWEIKNNNIPLLNEKNAEKVYNLIGRKFGSFNECCPTALGYMRKLKFLKLKRYTFKRRFTKAWITKPHEDAPSYKNYGRLVHDISHYMQKYRNDNINHSRPQSKLELQITMWVIQNTWFRNKIL